MTANTPAKVSVGMNPEPEVYDPEKQYLKLKGNTAGFDGEGAYPGISPRNHFRFIHLFGPPVLWDVQFARTGVLDVALHFANSQLQAGAEVEIDVDGEKTSAITPFTGAQERFVSFRVGSLSVKRTGCLTVKMRCTKYGDKGLGRFAWLELSGPAAVGSSEDAVPKEICPVNLEAGDKDEHELYYTSITPTMTHFESVFHVFHFRCGWVSLRDAVDQQNYKKVEMLVYPEYKTDDFVPEPEQVQNITVVKASHRMGRLTSIELPWDVNETYHFVIKAERVQGEDSVLYSSYVYFDDLRQWKLIATYKVTKKTSLLGTMRHRIVPRSRGLQQGYFVREASFGPTWCRAQDGTWKELTSFVFAQDEPHLNTDAGVKDNRVFLRTGGHTNRKCALGTTLTVQPTKALPQILQDIDKKLREV